MSVRSLTALAVERDSATPKAHGTGDLKTKELLSSGDALVSAIPTEPLAIYTGLVSGVVALLPEVTNRSNSYLPLRWWLYGGSAFFVMLWVVGGYVVRRRRRRSSKNRKFPTAEVFSALLAFGTWGLVMPESPLRITLNGTTEGVATLCISVGGAAALYLFAQWGLTKQVTKPL